MEDKNSSQVWVSVSVAAHRLGRSVSTIYRWASKGDLLQENRVGRRRYVSSANVESLFKNRAVSPEVKSPYQSAMASAPETISAIMATISPHSDQTHLSSESPSQHDGQRDLQFRWKYIYQVAIS